MRASTLHTAPSAPMSRVCTDKPVCDHLTGYWINQSAGQFRCFDCGFQFNTRDVSPNETRELQPERIGQ